MKSFPQRERAGVLLLSKREKKTVRLSDSFLTHDFTNVCITLHSKTIHTNFPATVARPAPQEYHSPGLSSSHPRESLLLEWGHHGHQVGYIYYAVLFLSIQLAASTSDIFDFLLGTFSGVAATSCTPCPPGSACPNISDSNQVVPCTAGSYSVGSAPQCTLCPPARFCPHRE